MYNRFIEYLEEWKRLDSIKIHWFFKYVLYIPFGFILEMKILNKKSKLTEEYNKYLDTFIK
jgi:glycopeptide antibiotics resistance protein